MLGALKSVPKMISFQAHGRILGDDGGIGEHDKGLGKSVKNTTKKSKP
jgi:hypothetical protein